MQSLWNNLAYFNENVVRIFLANMESITSGSKYPKQSFFELQQNSNFVRTVEWIDELK